jgi:hypothetical protein
VKTWLPIFLVFLLGVLALAAFSTRGRTPRYRARPLMSNNELEFFGRLSRALPEMFVFPQVAMAALIEPAAKGKGRGADFLRISQKRTDYCLYQRDSMSLVAIVELDDRTHLAAADVRRDAYTASAGIRTLRFESKNKPSEAQLRQAVAALALPTP